MCVCQSVYVHVYVRVCVRVYVGEVNLLFRADDAVDTGIHTSTLVGTAVIPAFTLSVVGPVVQAHA